MKHLLSLILIGVATLSVRAQNVTNSPYSRFGIGELQSVTSATYSGMGGVGIGINNPVSINVLNPASYASVFPQRFTMQASLSHTTTQMSTLTNDQIANSTKFNYLIMSFPVTKWWGSSFGLLPYSEVSYNYSDYDAASDAKLEFEGFGGINKLYWGNGFKIGKKFSAGVNLNYLFGRLNTQRRVIFSDDSFNSKSEEESVVSGFQYNFGLLYNQKIKDWNLSIGLILDNNNEINSKTTLTVETFEYVGTVESVKNVISSEALQQNLVLPSAIGFGASLANNKWLLAADYKATDWSEFEFLDQEYNLQKCNKLSLGAEFIPEIKSINNYPKIIRYRMGLYTGSSYLNLEAQSIDYKAITLGLGLPLKRSGALINISAELGTRGTTDAGLIEDKFAVFKIGLVLSDVWFIKRKYD